MFRRLLLAACCAAIAAPAVAQEHSHDHAQPAAQAQWQAPVVEQAWSRAMPPTAPTGAVYFRLHNPAGIADRLVGVTTERAEKAELHEHVHENGLMRMREVPSVDVPARGVIEFKPGGHHVMLFGLKQPLVAGDRFPLTLQLETAGEVQVEVEILEQAPASHGQPGAHHGHMQH